MYGGFPYAGAYYGQGPALSPVVVEPPPTFVFDPFVVGAEDRVFGVDAEDRVFSVSLEDRVFRVKSRSNLA